MDYFNCELAQFQSTPLLETDQKQDFKTFGKNIGLCTLHDPHNGFSIDPIKKTVLLIWE